MFIILDLFKIMCFKSFFHSTNLEGDIIRIEGYTNRYFFSSNHDQDLFPTNWTIRSSKLVVFHNSWNVISIMERYENVGIHFCLLAF
jgi:hypothetical protein